MRRLVWVVFWWGSFFFLKKKIAPTSAVRLNNISQILSLAQQVTHTHTHTVIIIIYIVDIYINQLAVFIIISDITPCRQLAEHVVVVALVVWE